MTDSPRALRSSQDAKVEVLLASAELCDHLALRRMFDHTNWHLLSCNDMHQLENVLMRSNLGVVICREHLPSGSWMDALSCCKSKTDAPKLIVASSHPTTKLWSEVIGAGADYVFPIPFHYPDVLRNVADAWARWFFTRSRESKVADSSSVTVGVGALPGREYDCATAPQDLSGSTANHDNGDCRPVFSLHEMESLCSVQDKQTKVVSYACKTLDE